MWVYVFISLRYILESGIAESYGKSILNILRNYVTVCHSGCTNLQSQHPCVRIPISHYHLLLSVFLIFFRDSGHSDTTQSKSLINNADDFVLIESDKEEV